MEELRQTPSTQPAPRTNSNAAHALLDVLAVTRSLCRWNARISRGNSIESIVHRAVREATGPRPGPVFLSVPVDVWREPYQTQPFHFAREQKPIASREGCKEAADLLA